MFGGKKSTILRSSALRGNDLAALGYLRIIACKIDRLMKSESVKTASHAAQVKNQDFFLKRMTVIKVLRRQTPPQNPRPLISDYL